MTTAVTFAPNQVVGYRIKPDWHSFNVVLVKVHGPNSKNAGQTYETTIAYCGSISSAMQYVLNHSLRVRGELAQDDEQRVSGSIADIKALAGQVEAALADALAAGKALEEVVLSMGLTNKEMVMRSS